jgi:hypothetical protein
MTAATPDVVCRLLFVALALQAPAALAQGIADELIAAYSKLGSYCARARASERAGGGGMVRELEHCILGDGRFRAVASSPALVEVTWSDGERQHYHHRGVGAVAYDSYGNVPAFRMNAPDLPPILQRSLGWYGLPVADMASLRARFKAFELNEELSTPELAAYEAPAGEPLAGQRVWLAREDGLIRRAGWRNPNLGEVVLTEMRRDPVIAPEALRHEAPAAAQVRYAVKQNLLELALVLSVLSFGLGLAFGQLRRRAIGETVSRARAWRFYRWLLLSVPPAILLALFAPTGDDMGGAARLIEHIAWGLGYLYALWLVGLFLLARSLAASGVQPPQRGG